MAQRTCSIPGCLRPHQARGWCNTHYQRWRMHGTVDLELTTTAERFWAKVNRNGPVPAHAPELRSCWVWTAYKSPRGYGRFNLDGTRIVLAHRWSYTDANGPIPSDRPELDHLCWNTSCVRPSHLEPVTRKQNAERSEPTRRTHCPHGHEYTPENTIYENGWRKCRTCVYSRLKRYSPPCGPKAHGLLTTEEKARREGMSIKWVRVHAVELGGVKPGGKRLSHWGFPP